MVKTPQEDLSTPVVLKFYFKRVSVPRSEYVNGMKYVTFEVTKTVLLKPSHSTFVDVKSDSQISRDVEVVPLPGLFYRKQ